jgi:hypothetical protein
MPVYPIRWPGVYPVHYDSDSAGLPGVHRLERT